MFKLFFGNYCIMKDLHVETWLPSFWFFLYSTAHGYPDEPNSVMKRKYYDFIQNLPLFCPNAMFRKHLEDALNIFPVRPYLDNRDSFTYWVHFVQNKMNQKYGLEERTYHQHLDEYYNTFLPKTYRLSEKFGIQKRHILLFLFTLLGIFIFYHTK